MHSNSDNIEFIIYDNADEVIEAGPGNGFQSGGPRNTEDYCRAPFLADKKNF